MSTATTITSKQAFTADQYIMRKLPGAHLVTNR
jgi:hypothetical protein